jgi:hypothetical protein
MGNSHMHDGHDREPTTGAAWKPSKGIALALTAIPVVLLATGIIVLALIARWTDSGIGDALWTDRVLTTAGASQGVVLTSSSSNGASSSESSAETSRRVHAKLTSGSRSQLLAAYRDAVKKEIESRGGIILGGGDWGGSEIRDFSFNFTVHGGKGIVMVWSFQDADGEIDVITFCYEHRN